MKLRLPALLLVVALAGGACSGDDDTSAALAADDTTTSTLAAGGSTTTTRPASTRSTPSTSSTTTSSSTTTTEPEVSVTTLPEGVASPLNGLAATDVELLDRRALAVKIDNHLQARPQSGIEHADAIVELRVEGGFTRFIAFFHDNDIDYLGPIRSLRPTDATVARAAGAPIVISGGQPWIQQLVARQGVGLIGEGRGTFRLSSRGAPHNLYGSTETLRAVADSRGYDDDPPGPIVAVGLPDLSNAEPAETIDLDWGEGNHVTWIYEDGVYARYQGGLRHDTIDRDGEATQITVDHLVVLEGVLSTAYPPGDGTPVPQTDTLSGGRAYLFARGVVVEGTWTRAGYDEPFVITTPEGDEVTMPPGRPWINVFPEGQPITWS
ncbi:MAG TPA: DUF3048 domain-containing protein [Acidimicrobiia bacterium]|nr:DUF3048 domain-containing protein [Acidimicrobiia bacterium]